MSEYKFVQWGKGVPVDYQRLGQMASNDEYLKSKVDPVPKGVLAWKQYDAGTGGLSLTDPTGGFQPISTFTSIPFNCDENRLISFSFNSGRIQSNGAGEIRWHFVVDGVRSTINQGTIFNSGYYSDPSIFYYIQPTVLAKGSHTVSVEYIATNTISTVTLGQTNGTISLTVRDEGVYIDPVS